MRIFPLTNEEQQRVDKWIEREIYPVMLNEQHGSEFERMWYTREVFISVILFFHIYLFV